MDKVIATYELLENILGHLSPDSGALSTARLVCHHWKDIIQQNKRLDRRWRRRGDRPYKPKVLNLRVISGIEESINPLHVRLVADDESDDESDDEFMEDPSFLCQWVDCHKSSHSTAWGKQHFHLHMDYTGSSHSPMDRMDAYVLWFDLFHMATLEMALKTSNEYLAKARKTQLSTPRLLGLIGIRGLLDVEEWRLAAGKAAADELSTKFYTIARMDGNSIRTAISEMLDMYREAKVYGPRQKISLSRKLEYRTHVTARRLWRAAEQLSYMYGERPSYYILSPVSWLIDLPTTIGGNILGVISVLTLYLVTPAWVAFLALLGYPIREQNR